MEIITRQLKRQLVIFLGGPASRTPREKSPCSFFMFFGGKVYEKGAGEKRGHFGTDGGQRFRGEDGVALLRHDSKLFFF